jgi:hypothetical protein
MNYKSYITIVYKVTSKLQNLWSFNYERETTLPVSYSHPECLGPFNLFVSSMTKDPTVTCEWTVISPCFYHSQELKSTIYI